MVTYVYLLKAVDTSAKSIGVKQSVKQSLSVTLKQIIFFKQFIFANFGSGKKKIMKKKLF